MDRKVSDEMSQRANLIYYHFLLAQKDRKVNKGTRVQMYNLDG